jgi:hypothetical protein
MIVRSHMYDDASPSESGREIRQGVPGTIGMLHDEGNCSPPVLRTLTTWAFWKAARKFGAVIKPFTI